MAIFSFSDETASDLEAEAAPTAVSPDATSTPAPAPEDLLTEVRDALRDFLPPASEPLPAPTVALTGVMEKPVGLGNFRGYERRGGFTTVALKGGRLLLEVRFHLWAGSAAAVGEMADALHGRLLAAKDELWRAGFLKMSAQGATLPEHSSTLNGWGQALEYQFLYEYHYEDSEGAEGLIARIPIHTDPETEDSPQRESNVVTDALARWDQETAPPLELSGRLGLSRLTLLAFVPGAAPADPVALVRTFVGAAAPPTDYPTLDDFITAVTDPDDPERNGRFTFPSFSDFLAACDVVDDPITLGDWDEDSVPDDYEVRALTWSPPLRLTKSTDRLQLIYAPGSGDPRFDQVAIVYVRARP